MRILTDSVPIRIFMWPSDAVFRLGKRFAPTGCRLSWPNPPRRWSNRQKNFGEVEKTTWQRSGTGYGNRPAAQRPGFGVLAQLVEHLHGMQGVSGSNPLGSTKSRQAIHSFCRFFQNDIVRPARPMMSVCAKILSRHSLTGGSFGFIAVLNLEKREVLPFFLFLANCRYDQRTSRRL